MAGSEENETMQHKILVAFAAAAALLGGATLASEASPLPGPGTGSATNQRASVVHLAGMRDFGGRRGSQLNRAFNDAIERSARATAVTTRSKRILDESKARPR
jgi:hypothetical protein